MTRRESELELVKLGCCVARCPTGCSRNPQDLLPHDILATCPLCPPGHLEHRLRCSLLQRAGRLSTMAHGERRQNQSHCRKDDPGREGRADDPTGQRVGQGPRRHHHPGPGVDAQRGQFGSGERQQALGLGGFLHRAPEARAEVAARDSADLRRGCSPRPQQPPRCGCFSAQHRSGLHPESAVGRGNRADHRAGSAGFRDPMDLRPFGCRAAGHSLGAGL